MANITRYRTAKGENRYRVRYRKPDGTQTDKRGFRRKIDAETWAAEHVTIAKATGSYIDPEGGKQRIGTLHDQWIAEKKPFWKATSGSNMDSAWKCHCEAKWAERQIGSITHAEVQAWVGSIIDKSGAPSVSRPYQIMQGICSMAVRDKLISSNPCDGIELPRLPKRKDRRIYLTITRLLALANEASNCRKLGEERRALILLLGFCGLRWGEAAGLQRRDLDFDAGILHVRRNLVYVNAKWAEGTPKNHERRDVPMPRIVMDALKPICEQREHEERVFRDVRGGPIRKQSLARETGWWTHTSGLEAGRLAGASRPASHRRLVGRACGRERQGPAEDAGPQEREHDAGRVRGSVRQRPYGRGPSARCRRAGGDGRGRMWAKCGQKRFEARLKPLKTLESRHSCEWWFLRKLKDALS